MRKNKVRVRLPNVRGVPRFSYELAKKIWRFPNEFAMIRMTYRCKIVEVRNQPVQVRIDWQYGRLRHHSLGYLQSHFFYFRQVAEGTKNSFFFSTPFLLKASTSALVFSIGVFKFRVWLQA